MLLSTAAGGCTTKSTLDGQARFDGQPIEQGQVTLVPVDGRGPTSGGMISQGVYHIENLTPGKKRVEVIGIKKVPFVASSAEMEAAAQLPRPPGANADLVYPADTISEDAQGNHVELEIQPGVNHRDFDLRSAK